MANKNDILKMARHVFRRGQSIPDRRLMHPKREWAIGLIVALAVMVVGFWYNLDRFSYYRDLESAVPPNSIRIVPLNNLLMKEVLTDFSKRREIYEDFKTAEVENISAEEE